MEGHCGGSFFGMSFHFPSVSFAHPSTNPASTSGVPTLLLNSTMSSPELRGDVASSSAIATRKRPRPSSSAAPLVPEMSSPARIYERSYAVRRVLDPATGKRSFNVCPISCTARLRAESTVASTYLSSLPALASPPASLSAGDGAAEEEGAEPCGGGGGGGGSSSFPPCPLAPTLIVHCHANGLCILTIGDLLSVPSPSSGRPWSVSSVTYASHIKVSVDTLPAGKGKANKKKYDAATGRAGSDNNVRAETVVCRVALRDDDDGEGEGRTVVVPIPACVEGVVIEYNDLMGTEEGRKLLRDDPMGAGFLAIIKPKYKFPNDEGRLPKKEYLKLKLKEMEEKKAKN